MAGSSNFQNLGQPWMQPGLIGAAVGGMPLFRRPFLRMMKVDLEEVRQMRVAAHDEEEEGQERTPTGAAKAPKFARMSAREPDSDRRQKLIATWTDMVTTLMVTTTTTMTAPVAAGSWAKTLTSGVLVGGIYVAFDTVNEKIKSLCKKRVKDATTQTETKEKVKRYYTTPTGRKLHTNLSCHYVTPATAKEYELCSGCG